MSSVRYFGQKMIYGKGTREEQVSRLQKEIEDADAGEIISQLLGDK